MNKPKTQEGIVGFFDILGYSNFLENNEPEDAAIIIKKVLLDLNTDLANHILNMLPGEELERGRIILQSLKPLVFSDTILYTLPYTEDMDDLHKLTLWLLFTNHSIVLYRHLFDLGLSIRGSISFGKFFIEEYCFAGQNIVDSYKRTQSLDLSIVVLESAAIIEFRNLNIKICGLTKYNSIQTYNVPHKNSKSQYLTILAPSCKSFSTKLPSDFRKCIINSFEKHNKVISLSETSKIDNTELFFRFFKSKMPDLFEK
ncbi:MAG: hypothetical protein HQ568_07440 [Calditrichaeota bacterium]|nr:hypothetical protein [Calditrichota bacterium]